MEIYKGPKKEPEAIKAILDANNVNVSSVEDGRSILVQSDCDYPGFASSFGWSLRDVQRLGVCPDCCDGDLQRSGEEIYCASCEYLRYTCDHNGTDGTVICPGCGCAPSEFMAAAYDFLTSNDGLTVDDPGYFDEMGE